MSNRVCIFHRFDLHDSVEIISTELDFSNHSDLLEKCAEYFMAKGIFESAVKLLANAKKVSPKFMLDLSINKYLILIL